MPEAIRHYTRGSAYLASRERELGRLVAGMLADFVLTRGDIATIQGGDMAGIHVSRVFVGGSEADLDGTRSDMP